ncbi:MAG: MazG nucleotide pyrophosphohydrolase domain-containing protein [Phycisphaerales bacterium]
MSNTALTVRGFQELIRERYYATDSARGGAGTFLLFMEEVGELATAIHDNRPVGKPPAFKRQAPTEQERANLEEEFADVMAWLMTLANIHDVDIEAALRKYTDAGRVEGIKE